MLTSYLFMEKFKIEAAKGKSIFAADMWSLFYIHRYIRLTPIYLVIMILDVTLFTYISDGPFWRSIECMGWTWYLANDMQFHFFAPIFLILFYKQIFYWKIVSISILIFRLQIICKMDHPMNGVEGCTF
uniref:Uncharacterized protein n=1 Tax=Parascaris equorum TaxID=6256 RepID=A0A914RCI2_PAREQ